MRAPARRAADIKQYNPQFEDEYVAGKDYDPDRCVMPPKHCSPLQQYRVLLAALSVSPHMLVCVASRKRTLGSYIITLP